MITDRARELLKNIKDDVMETVASPNKPNSVGYGSPSKAAAASVGGQMDFTTKQAVENMGYG
jgi:hypothetical protein